MFDGFSTIQDLGAYENEIFNALQEYCDDREDIDVQNAILKGIGNRTADSYFTTLKELFGL